MCVCVCVSVCVCDIVLCVLYPSIEYIIFKNRLESHHISHPYYLSLGVCHVVCELWFSWAGGVGGDLKLETQCGRGGGEVIAES